MSHDTQEYRRSSSVAVKPPTHTHAGHGDADAAEGAERSRQSRALRGDRLPSAELERAALGTGGKSSDRRLSPCGVARVPPAVLPVFTLRCDPVRLFCEGLLCAWLRRRVVPKPEPSLPPLTECAFCQGERARRASDRSERDGVTGGWRHRR